MTKRESIIEKIKALLAKTVQNGCTEAEMMTALGMAQALQDTYIITTEELQLAKDEAAILASHRQTQTTRIISGGMLLGWWEDSATLKLGRNTEPNADTSSFAGLLPMSIWRYGCSNTSPISFLTSSFVTS
jgi:hypothetical protein